MPATSSPSGDADVALLYGFVEEVARRDAHDVAERFLSPDFVAHDGESARAAPEFVAGRVARHARFPGAVWTIELLADVGGLVICHTTLTFPGSSGCGPAMWETFVARVAAGRIAECWCACDERLRTAGSHVP